MGRLMYGINHALDDEATALIKASLEGVTRNADKSDILTPWKEKDRKDREVYTDSGTPDPAFRKGMFRRAWNSRDSHLNSRDGHVRGRRVQSFTSIFADDATGGTYNSDQNPD
jgi:hypothetical protein